MYTKKVVIIGGVAGGASTAARLRRLDEKASITMLEKGPYISFANCGLPYYIGDVIQEQEELELMTPDLFSRRFNVDVRTEHEALLIDREQKKVKVINHRDNEEYWQEYDFCVLSPGASPIKPSIPGIESVDSYTLRTIPDSVTIKSVLEDKNAKRAVVIGGGFIGIEMAENLRHQGLSVTLVEMAEQVMTSLDYEIAQFIHMELVASGVELVLGDGIASFARSESGSVVTTKSGKKIETDIVIMAIGVKPDSALAQSCGLEIDSQSGHIVVDEYMHTSDPNIFAVGDAVKVKHYLTKMKVAVALAGPANKQGRIAAENIAGRDTVYSGVLGTGIVKVFNLSAASTGLNEKTIINAKKVNYEKIYVHPHNHAGYYPGSVPLTIKLIFRKPDGLILGAQIVGTEGVDKRIDVIAAAMQKYSTVFDLEKMELAYAPPFGSAKDPVNMAGFVASNVLHGDMPVVHWNTIGDLHNEDTFILDVRTEQEYAMGHISGACNIPDTQLRTRLEEVPRDKPVMVYCQVGFRGYLATRTLLQHGFSDVFNLAGGYKLYNIANKTPDELQKLFTPVSFKSEEEEELGRPVDDTVHVHQHENSYTIQCDGLQCPGPIMKVAQKIKEIPFGSLLMVTATDPGFSADLPAWCRTTRNELVSLKRVGSVYQAVIKKSLTPVEGTFAAQLPTDKVIVLFSGDLDKALAAFIIANGAAAMGRKVTVFATFWGLNALKKDKKPNNLKKTFIQNMFGMMMPRGAEKLPLSQMNMMGLGPSMIKGIMKKYNVDMLDDMIKKALESGIRVVACQMSMELMGIQKDELIDEVELGGVVAFLESSEKSDTNLFIS